MNRSIFVAEVLESPLIACASRKNIILPPAAQNGHTVPAIETLEKMARALEVPTYQLFYDGDDPPKLPNLPKRRSADDVAWGSSCKDGRYLNKLRRLLAKAEEEDRKLLSRCDLRIRMQAYSFASRLHY